MKRASLCEHLAHHLAKAHELRRFLERRSRRAAGGRAEPYPVPGIGALAYREREVVFLAASGKTSKVIAHELGIADTTVRVLLARAALKLGAKRRADLFAHPTVRALLAAEGRA